MALSHAYADVLSYQERRILLEASKELIDTTLMDLGASDHSD
jgi:hypothetical protein